MISDADLLARYQAGRSSGVFTQIVERHGAMVLRTCQRLLGNLHDAEDVAQATFGRLAERPEAVSGPLGVWLHGIARRKACDLVRSGVRRHRREEEAARMRTHSTPLMETDLAGWREELDAGLDSLPERQREAVILRYLEGRKQDEAARLAGCPQGTMARRSSEGLHQLRDVLARRGTVFSVAVLTGLLAEEAASAALAGPAVAGLKTWAAGVAINHGSTVAASTAGKTMAWVKLKWLVAATSGLVATGLTAFLALSAKPAGPPMKLHATMERHAGGVLDLAVSPDRSTLASGGSDYQIRLWSMDTLETLAVFPGHNKEVAAVAYSPDGQLLASGSDDGVLKLWRLSDRQEIATVQAHLPREGVSSLAFAPDGKLLATGGWDGAVKLWDPVQLEPQGTLEGHTSGVSEVAFTPDGAQLISAGNDHIINLWNVSTKSVEKTLTGHQANIASMAVSPDGQALASGSRDGVIIVWDRASGLARTTFTAHPKSEVIALAWSPNGQWLVSGGQDRLVHYWDPTSAENLGTLKGHRSGVAALRFVFDATLLTGSYDRTIKVWQND